MKKIILLLSLLPSLCFAESENEKAFARAQDLKDFLDADLIVKTSGNPAEEETLVKEMEDVLRKKDPNIVDELQDQSPEVKYTEYKARLAELAFREYEDVFVKILEEKGKETGRKVKFSRFEYPNDECQVVMTYWLDNGDLDKDECHIKADVMEKLKGEEFLKYEREHTCYYPEGFEEHKVYVDKNVCGDFYLRNRYGEVSKIWVFDDYKDKNIRNTYDITLLNNSNVGNNNSNHINLTIGQSIEKYDEYQEYRNNVVADIKAGMYEYNKEHDYYYVDYKNKKWKSSILPGQYVRQYSTDFSSFSTKDINE